ncbi:MAG: hypothetical protein ABEI99_08385, partial [Halobaculum sp.]
MHEYGYVVNVDCAVVRDANDERDTSPSPAVGNERDTDTGRDPNTEPTDGARIEQPEYLLIRRSERESHAAGVVAFPGGKLEAGPGAD